MQLDFDLASVDESAADVPTGPVPEGKYLLQVINIEDTTFANGAGVKLTFGVTMNGQPCAGRKLWQRYILKHNTSAQAQNIGRAQLKALSMAACNMAVKDTLQLMGKHFTGEVRHEKYKDKLGEEKLMAKVVKYLPGKQEVVATTVDNDDMIF